MIPLQEAELICPYDKNAKLNETGKKLFAKGQEILKSSKKLGVVILSGGEGTRLGLTYPKGLFEVEGATLFEWHLKRLQILKETYGTEIYLFIMTSDSTDSQVREFLSKKSFNFIKKIDVFKQSSVEAIDMQTKEKLYKNGKVIKNPVGNGDFFDAIRKSKYMNEVEIFNVISVDNVMANILDEVFVGAFYTHELEVLSKAVKALPNESVGAFFKNGDHINIEEYSESKSRVSMGSVYGNICNHLFSADFVKRVGNEQLPLHEAFKKIPYTDKNGNLIKPTTPNGIKKEKFIFDSFEFTTNNGVMSVPRHLEFSPLKNSIESQSDNPITCSKSIKQFRINPKMISPAK